MQAKYRLKSRASFGYIYRKGKTLSNREMTLVYCKSAYGLKVGFSVSKKVGNSVVRNRVKRRMRENFRQMIPDVCAGFSYIFVARSIMAEKSFAEIGASMRTLLKKADKLISAAQTGDVDK